MTYYKLLKRVTCPQCGKVHELQKWSETKGNKGVFTIGRTESNKNIRDLNRILDKQGYICSCGYKYNI